MGWKKKYRDRIYKAFAVELTKIVVDKSTDIDKTILDNLDSILDKIIGDIYMDGYADGTAESEGFDDEPINTREMMQDMD